MKLKRTGKVILILLVLGILISSIYLIDFYIGNSVKAHNKVLTSDEGVTYNKIILREFRDKEFVGVTIKSYDPSYLNILVSELPEDEIRLIIFREGNEGVWIDLTKEAFFKVIEDENINDVHYSRGLSIPGDGPPPPFSDVFFWILFWVSIIALMIFIVINWRE